MTHYAIGVGCRRGCQAEDIVALVREVCGHSLAAPRPIGLFTIDIKLNETGLHAAAAVLGLPLAFFSAAELEASLESVMTRSAAVARIAGVPSVAEAAALAGAGPGARLLGPRTARAGATCAVAIGEDRP